MTSATIRHARGASHGESYGMVVFAAVLLWVVGIFNVIDGTAAIARSSVFIGNARYVAGDLRAWGWVVLILGALQVLASIAVMVGNQAPRWFAVAGDRPQRHRPDVLHPRLPVLVAHDHRLGRGGSVGTVRLRKPRERTA